jgi:hypothetical protein
MKQPKEIIYTDGSKHTQCSQCHNCKNCQMCTCTKRGK